MPPAAASGQEVFEEAHLGVRIRQVEAHEHGQEHADEDGKQGEEEVLLSDHFMVGREDVAADEAHWFPPAAWAAVVFIQLSNSCGSMTIKVVRIW